MSYYDSTVASYNAQISNHNQTISECNVKIKKCEDDIEELRRLKAKMDGVDNAIDIAVAATSSKISNLPSLITNPFAFLKMNYFSSFLDLIKGSDHTKAKHGIGNAILKINNQIKESQNEINRLRFTITKCQVSIATLNQQKSSYISNKENQQRMERLQHEIEETLRGAIGQ